MMSHRSLLAFVLSVVAATTATGMNAPNVVVILADDLGWNAVGYHNERFETPNIDRLVAEGMELNRFYVAPMCSPTRAGLMTGRYPIRFGCARAVIPPQRDFGLPTEETTLGEALSQLGYQQRGVFGKWHLGHRRAKWHPLLQGFTHFHGHYNGAIDYFDLTREGERDWHVDFEPSPETAYSTDLIAKASAAFIANAAKQDAPFLCYVPFNAPHSPFQAPAEAIDRFAHLNASPGKAARRAANRPHDILPTYAAMIWKMDQGIGAILDAVEASGESENTIVWFFSDNGGVGNIPENNAPLRGSKLTVYEGGIRVPAAIRWPAKIQPGTTCQETCGYIDILPTLVAAAGGQGQPNGSQPLDGMNLLPLLISDSSAELTADQAQAFRTRPWFSYHGQQGEANEHLSVLLDGWKLKINGPRLESLSQLQDGKLQVELFHLANDPFEQQDQKAEQPTKVDELARQLITYRALQPMESVPPYNAGKRGFVPPRNWKLDPRFPERLVGKDD